MAKKLESLKFYQTLIKQKNSIYDKQKMVKTKILIFMSFCYVSCDEIVIGYE